LATVPSQTIPWTVELAEAATASTPADCRLTNLGAILYRAGRFEDAIRRLSRAVAVHGAPGTRRDAFFPAMAHHQLGHAEEAGRWIQVATAVNPIPMRKPDGARQAEWVSSQELEILRLGVSALIKPLH
jgi:hypothetical protein